MRSETAGAILPPRIQMSRRRGWRKPPGAIYVGRPGKFGNPFRAAGGGRAVAVERYEAWIQSPAQAALLAAAKSELSGRVLACWCPLDAPCHADVLRRLAKRDEVRSR